MDFVVVIEKAESSFGAYVPDLPGCIAIGETREEVLALIRDAIELHLQGLQRNGLSVPAPNSFIELVHIDT